MSQALYRKWRPHLWEQVVGQEHVVRTLQNAIRSEKVGHAYLFAGPRGTGKTTTARLLAKAVNCLDPKVENRPCDKCAHCQAVNDGRFLDLIEIDAASNTSVDDVRDLRDKINYSPTQGLYKVYIIDEVHMLSTAAFNALLKTLEEPPPHAIFILATTEMHKIPATVLSRCQRHEFRRIPVKDIVAELKMLAGQEKIDIDEDALLMIARQATGSLRDAISLLDQLSSMGEHIQLDMAQKVLGTATNQLVIELVDAILARRTDQGLDCIHRALDSGSDPRQFARQMVDYLRGLLLIRLGNPDRVEATPEIRQQMLKHAENYALGHLLETIRLFNNAAVDSRSGWQPGLQLELALAESTAEKSAERGSPPAAAPAQPSSKPARAEKAAPEPAAAEKEPLQAATSHPSAPEVPAKEGEAKPAAKKAEEKAVKEPQAQDQLQPSTPSGPAQVEASTAQPKFSFQDILQNWNSIKGVVKKARFQTAGLMNSCKPLAIKDGILILGFVNDLIKQKMEANDNILILRQGIYSVMGIEIPIACVVMNSKTSTDLPSDLDIEGDGIVGTALNLGGKIVQKD